MTSAKAINRVLSVVKLAQVVVDGLVSFCVEVCSLIHILGLFMLKNFIKILESLFPWRCRIQMIALWIEGVAQFYIPDRFSERIQRLDRVLEIVWLIAVVMLIEWDQ